MKSRQEIQAAVARAEKAHETATANLTEARKAYQIADEQWIERGAKRDRETRSERADEMERCETLQKRAAQKLDLARSELTALVREERLQSLSELRAKLSTFSDTLATHAAEFVTLDRAVEARVMALAVEVRGMIETYDTAKQIADDLRVQGPDGPRPDLANVSLAIRKVVTRARVDEHRDPLAPHWLANVDTDWKLREQRAEDLTDLERVGARNAQIARDQREAAAYTAGMEAGKQPPPTETNPQTEAAQ